MAKFKLNNKFFDIPDDNIEAINSIKADGGILIDKIQTDIQRKQLTSQPTPKQQPQTETYLLQGKKYQIPISETNAINSIKADGGKLIIESIETKDRESLKQNYLNTIKSNLQNIENEYQIGQSSFLGETRFDPKLVEQNIEQIKKITTEAKNLNIDLDSPETKKARVFVEKLEELKKYKRWTGDRQFINALERIKNIADIEGYTEDELLTKNKELSEIVKQIKKAKSAKY